MPFVVQCPFCGLRARVPDRALAASGRCPRCESNYTLVPADDQHVPASVAPAAEVDNVEATVEQPSQMAAAIAVAAILTDVPGAAAGASGAEVADTCPTTAGTWGPGLAAAAALWCGAAALCCASFTGLCGLVRPLAMAGLASGGVALALVWRERWNRRYLLPGTATAVCAALVVGGFGFPTLLGPTYHRYRDAGAAAPRVLRAIPLGGAPMLAQVPDWVDARRYALQCGDLHVRSAHARRSGSRRRTRRRGSRCPRRCSWSGCTSSRRHSRTCRKRRTMPRSTGPPTAFPACALLPGGPMCCGRPRC